MNCDIVSNSRPRTDLLISLPSVALLAAHAHAERSPAPAAGDGRGDEAAPPGTDIDLLLSGGLGRGRLSSAGEAFLVALLEGGGPDPAANPYPKPSGAPQPAPAAAPGGTGPPGDHASPDVLAGAPATVASAAEVPAPARVAEQRRTEATPAHGCPTDGAAPALDGRDGPLAGNVAPGAPADAHGSLPSPSCAADGAPVSHWGSDHGATAAASLLDTDGAAPAVAPAAAGGAPEADPLSPTGDAADAGGGKGLAASLLSSISIVATSALLPAAPAPAQPAAAADAAPDLDAAPDAAGAPDPAGHSNPAAAAPAAIAPDVPPAHLAPEGGSAVEPACGLADVRVAGRSPRVGAAASAPALSPVRTRVLQLNAGPGSPAGTAAPAASPRQANCDAAAALAARPERAEPAREAGAEVTHGEGTRGELRAAGPAPRWRAPQVGSPARAMIQTPRSPARSPVSPPGRGAAPAGSPARTPGSASGPFACRVHPRVAAAAAGAGALPLRRASTLGADGAAIGRLVAVVPYAMLRGALALCTD